MSGRGRGRGRGGGMTFSAEALGFGRGEALPPPTLQPPPTFPVSRNGWVTGTMLSVTYNTKCWFLFSEQQLMNIFFHPGMKCYLHGYLIVTSVHNFGCLCGRDKQKRRRTTKNTDQYSCPIGQP